MAKWQVLWQICHSIFNGQVLSSNPYQHKLCTSSFEPLKIVGILKEYVGHIINEYL